MASIYATHPPFDETRAFLFLSPDSLFPPLFSPPSDLLFSAAPRSTPLHIYPIFAGLQVAYLAAYLSIFIPTRAAELLAHTLVRRRVLRPVPLTTIHRGLAPSALD